MNELLVNKVFCMDDVKKLREDTAVGAEVRFIVPTSSVYVSNGRERKTVEGRVVAKYPYIFKLDNGKSYSWVDYLMGKRK